MCTSPARTNRRYSATNVRISLTSTGVSPETADGSREPSAYTAASNDLSLGGFTNIGVLPRRASAIVIGVIVRRV